MKIELEIKYEVRDDDDEVAELVDQIIHQESRQFATMLTNRLADEGVRNIQLSVT